jgi:hypothetical protein
MTNLAKGTAMATAHGSEALRKNGRAWRSSQDATIRTPVSQKYVALEHQVTTPSPTPRALKTTTRSSHIVSKLWASARLRIHAYDQVTNFGTAQHWKRWIKWRKSTGRLQSREEGSVASTRFGPFLELRYIWLITCEIKIRLLRVGRGPLAF